MTLPLIPRPAELHYGPEADAFILDANTRIELQLSATDETLFAARQLQQAVEYATGLHLELRKTATPGGIALRITLRDLGPEGYELHINPSGVTLSAATEAGLFYGIQTLKQILRTHGGHLPALTIRDHPVLVQRGLMLDVSRGKVPTLETLFELVDGLAHYKYNELQLYIEHTFDFPSHPDIGAGTGPLTADDILALDAYCRARHVELVPNLQSFGHQRYMLSMPRYSHLDEVGWRWSLTPAREETYELLDELYADFLPNFESGWLNVDCDETWDLGAGQSKPIVEQIGKGRLYVQHILRLRELAAKYGRKIMLWADVLHHYPELVSELPDDVLLLDWQYEAADTYPTTSALGESGRQFWVCPGTSSWNTFFPRLDNALGNIRNFVRDGLRAGASGMLLTDWGDYGHYQALSLSWYPYLFGAATAWTGAQTTPEEFDRAFAPLFLGQPAGSAALESMRRLGRAVTAPTLGIPNRSRVALALFEEPLNGAVSASADPGALAEVESVAKEAIAAFATLPDAHLRWDYSFTARMIAFAASKALLARQIRDALFSGDGSRLQTDVDTLRAHAEYARGLRREFECVWLRHARRSEIQLTLDHFDALQRDYAHAINWLTNEPSADLSTYNPPPYPRLWERGQSELRTLATLAGAENLPENVQGWLNPAPV